MIYKIGRLVGFWCETFVILIFSTNFTSYYIMSILLYLIQCSIYLVIFYSPILFCWVFHYPTQQLDQSPLQSRLDRYYHYIIILFSIVFYYTKCIRDYAQHFQFLSFMCFKAYAQHKKIITHVLQSWCSTQTSNTHVLHSSCLLQIQSTHVLHSSLSTQNILQHVIQGPCPTDLQNSFTQPVFYTSIELVISLYVF